jgi:hypothetical protein
MTNETSQEQDNDSSDTAFSFAILPDDKKEEKVYLHEWLKNDGEWVEKGQPLYRIRVGEYLGIALLNASQPILSKKSGVLQTLKKKNDAIQDGEIICTIHPLGQYEKENTIFNESFSFYFDKFKYQIPEKYSHHQLKINEWHKQDGELVKKNDLILTLGYSTSYGNKETLYHYAETEGYLDKVRTQLDFIGLNQNELVYIIQNNDENRIKRKFVNTPDIHIDDFTGNKIIKWKQVGNNDGYSVGVSSTSIDNKTSLTFSFCNSDGKDYIIFQFYSKEIMLSKDDVISFLFTDNKIIDFKIESNSYKASHPYIEKLFENKVQITDDELQTFERNQFLKWKISLKKQNREIIGGNEGYSQYKSTQNLALVIKKLALEYRELVKSEIPNYNPLFQRATISNPTNETNIEECYVYLMIDINNQYHKIGISNKPEWREKTLQSEKPTIELIASKKFISRKIASSFEKALHESYEDKRIRGEWFRLDAKDIQEIKLTLTT